MTGLRRRAALDAAEQDLLHHLAGDPRGDPAGAADAGADKQWVRDQIACALRIASQLAPARIATAQQLVTQLPATLAALPANRLIRDGHSVAVASDSPLTIQAVGSCSLAGSARALIAVSRGCR